MRTIALALAASTSLAQDNEAQDRLHFADFKRTYGRTYESVDDEEYRFGVFRATLRRIVQNNADPEDGAEYGVTRWADRTSEELQARCGGSCVGSNCTRVTARRSVTAKTHAWDGTCFVKPRFPQMCDATVPEELDWTTLGAVTGIKDQGECGNCFTFGATCDMEAAWFLAGHDLISLSEQQLTSCDRAGGDGGCDGGDTNLDTDKYASKHGLNSENNYPYSSASYKKGKSGTCDKNLEASPVATFTNGYQISGGAGDCDWCNKQPIDEDVMRKHLATAGPFTIAINAMFMDSYKRGIASPNKALCCGLPMCLNHQVAIVGYGSENGVNYWKIRNSWGADWGEDGYYRIIRGDNRCGLAADASHVVATPSPAPAPPSPPSPAPSPTPPPSPPSPPSPAPSPTPPPSPGCPGGSLKDCIALCPAEPDAVYTACVANCGDKCSSSTMTV